MHLPILPLAMALLLAAPATATNLITNGSFETGDFTGWTVDLDPFNTSVTATPAAGGPVDGNFHARFASAIPGSIEQIIPTIAGASYTVRWNVAYTGGTPNVFAIRWDDILDANPFPAVDYTPGALNFLATGPTARLVFGFLAGGGGTWYFDDVSVTRILDPGPDPDPGPSPIPEPSTWLMLIAGFALTGAAARRHRTAAANITTRPAT